jgi:hypothetical protein
MQVDVGLHEEVKVGVGGLAIDRSPISADLSESEIGHEVNDNGDICLVNGEGRGESVVADEFAVYAEAKSDDGVYTADFLVVYGV